ncbi:MAG: hypothetical protein ACRC8S_19575 [Fimbriiglobus sp.]
MASLVPSRFLVRMVHPCWYVPKIPKDADEESLFELPDTCRMQNFAVLEERKNFADVRLAWNNFGLALQVTVTGKSETPVGDADKPRSSDGLTFWVDTRDSRTSHRANRFCHQFYFLPAGGGQDKTEAAWGQMKINRALQDAPLASPTDIPFRHHRRKGGYRLEAFFPANVLSGWDAEQHPRLGVYYHLRDNELGDQFLSVNQDFPFTDDPSLWEMLELRKTK